MGRERMFIRSFASRSCVMNAAQPAGVLPRGVRVFAIGDIHGRADLLRGLLGRIDAYRANAASPGRDVFVLIGDYIDRGPNSADVINMLISDIPRRCDEAVLLKGNHEVMFVDFLTGASDINAFLANGGRATVSSYGVRIDRYAGDEHWQDRLHAALMRKIPAPHLEVLQGLKLSWQLGGYMFVHAGVRPGVPLDQQSEDDLVWIRKPFLGSNEDFGKIIVHGHTPVDEPEIRKNRIAIDTGAVFTDRLTALVLQDDQQSFLST